MSDSSHKEHKERRGAEERVDCLTQRRRETETAEGVGGGFNTEVQEHSGWEVRRIKFTFTERTQKGFPDLPLLAATQNHGVILKSKYENRTVEATKALETLKLVEVGDFVISLRSFQGGLEMAYDRGIISPAYTILVPTHISGEYFKYFAKSSTFISILKSTVTGIREGQNIDYNRLRDYYIEIPPLVEQLAMSSYLDAETGRIDKAIAAEEKMIALLQERREIVINEAVGGVQNSHAEAQRRGELPKGWEIRRVKHLCTMQAGKNLTSNEILPQGNYPVFGANGQRGWYNKYNCEGDFLLIGRQGALCGNVHHVGGRFWATDHALITHIVVGINIRFVYYLFISANFNQYASQTAAQPGLAAGQILNVKLPFPPLIEQEAIVARLDEETGKIDRAIAVKRRQIELLRERRQIVIDEVVTGKVKVA